MLRPISKKGPSKRARILRHLREHPGEWLLASAIARVLGLTRCTTITILARLSKFGVVESRTVNHGRPGPVPKGWGLKPRKDADEPGQG